MKTIQYMAAFISLLLTVFNLSAQWQTIQTSTSNNLADISIINPNIIWVSGDNAILKSTDGGQSWLTINTPTGGWIYHIFAIDVNIAWCTGDNSGSSIFKTIDGGMNWTMQVYSPTQFINGIHFFNQNTGILLTDPTQGEFGFFITRNGGSTWYRHSTGLSGTVLLDNCLGALDTNLVWFPGQTQNGKRLFKLSGGLGNNWVSYAFLNNLNMSHVVFKDFNTALATQGYNVQISTNGGMTWVIQNNSALNTMPTNFILIPGTDWIFANGGTIFRMSYDLCSTWQPVVNLQIAPTFGWMRALDTNNIYLAGANGKIYKYNFDYYGIEENSTTVRQFYLYQNYPNPFNPVTRIDYEILKTAYVRLSVYDFLGREVKILVNAVMSSGRHEVEFNGTNLPSGVYFYKLDAEDFTAGKKMILVK
jgi:photosystem II stability/assembly factor-like uncharacterized protein